MSREGSVKKDASGRWMFVVDVRSPGAATRRQVRRRGFKTKAEAVEALRDLQAKMRTGLAVDPSTVTVREFLEVHWLPSLAATVRPTTVDTYNRLVARHITPALGDVRLQQLERAAVTTWIARLRASGLSAKSVRNIHGVLSKALADAVELELVARNVATRPKGLPAVEHRAPRAWTADELRRFLVGTAEHRFGALWRLIAMTGCRRGEALGLRWADVDLDSATITITNQRTVAGGRVVEGPPKTKAGARTVAIDEGTVTVLRARRREQAADRLKMGAGWPAGDLVFTNADGTGHWPQTVTATFREVVEELGLPQIGVHGLRHTSATHLIASGLNPRVVQQRIGHSHVSVTLGLYTHVLPGHDREAAEALARAVGTSVTKP